MEYLKNLLPADVLWIKHHLKLAGVAQSNSYVELVPQRRRRTNRRVTTCGCTIQDYCDECQE